MHVFSDLQAYICTFNDCHERLKTFSTRTLWSRHELEAHFSEKSFRCHDCHESSVTFTDQESFLDHLNRIHGREALTHVHALGMAQAAAQSVPRSFTDQKCPLCAQTDWKSRREYFTHLGKHLEQISLAALPQEEDESEDDSDQGDEGNFTFKCICGFDDDDGNTILDDRCDTWQHIACYYGNHSQIPEEHLCVDCSPRNLDTAGASRLQKEIRGKAPVNPGTPLFQDAASANYMWPSSSPSLQALLQDESLTFLGNRKISRVKGETEDTRLLDESKRQQVNGQNLLNDEQQQFEKGQHNQTRHASQTYPPPTNLPSYERPFSPLQELRPMRREQQSPSTHHLLDDAPKDRSPSTKKHKCPHCSTEFTRHHNLKSHLLTHSQEMPYVCSTCRSRFRRLHDLKRHTKLHTGEPPHICSQCGRKFARGDALARHQKGPRGCPGTRSSPPVDENSPQRDWSSGPESFVKLTHKHVDEAGRFNFGNAGSPADNEFALPGLATSTFDDFLNNNTFYDGGDEGFHDDSLKDGKIMPSYLQPANSSTSGGPSTASDDKWIAKANP
jgi:DNA-directed RNA polymerase subunit RPC12/RpoP